MGNLSHCRRWRDCSSSRLFSVNHESSCYRTDDPSHNTSPFCPNVKLLCPLKRYKNIDENHQLMTFLRKDIKICSYKKSWYLRRFVNVLFSCTPSSTHTKGKSAFGSRLITSTSSIDSISIENWSRLKPSNGVPEIYIVKENSWSFLSLKAIYCNKSIKMNSQLIAPKVISGKDLWLHVFIKFPYFKFILFRRNLECKRIGFIREMFTASKFTRTSCNVRLGFKPSTLSRSVGSESKKCGFDPVMVLV